MKMLLMTAKKFATQIDEANLDALRAYARSSGRSISSVVNEAVGDFLGKRQLRPAFREAMDEIIDDHSELLQQLAR